jgi:N6-L-threonylcarbamoyladenine synthase
VRDGTQVMSNVVASQHDLHERYAGVVPEIASRAHVEKILPVIQQALKDAGVEHPGAGVDAIAVGNRPGLVGSLIVGVSAAKALAWSLNKPLIGVDHVRAHLHAALLSEDASPIENPQTKIQNALGLVISGGHTSLYHFPPEDRVENSLADPIRLGKTIDDAIGEAYDKAAVILDAGYPGGPALDRLAQTGDPNASDNPDLPVSMLSKDSLDFSFSGLKTALLYAVRGQPVGRGKAARFERSAQDLSETETANLAAAFQDAAVQAIVRKLERALGQLEQQCRRPEALILGGGVSANSEIRRRVQTFANEQGLDLHLPAMDYCVDNAAMIAGYAFNLLQAGETADLDLPVIATTKT